MVKPFKSLQMVVVVVFFLMIWLGLAGSAAAFTPCNDDRGCDSLSLCLNGVCQTSLGQPCNDDRGCLAGGRNLQCRNGVCTAVFPQCTQDAQCPVELGQLCVEGKCQTGFCRNNTHCGIQQVCGSNSRCRGECTAARHCATDQTCNTTTNLCVARCPSSQVFVRSNTTPQCTACVDPRAPHLRPTAQGGCPLGLIAADGFCIADCRPKLAPKPGPKDPAGIGIVPDRPTPQPAPGGVPVR